MQLAGRPVAAFDPEGLIFAAGINSESVKLYDLRSFDKGPFSSFKLNSKFFRSLEYYYNQRSYRNASFYNKFTHLNHQ